MYNYYLGPFHSKELYINANFTGTWSVSLFLRLLLMILSVMSLLEYKWSKALSGIFPFFSMWSAWYVLPIGWIFMPHCWRQFFSGIETFFCRNFGKSHLLASRLASPVIIILFVLLDEVYLWLMNVLICLTMVSSDVQTTKAVWQPENWWNIFCN